MRRGFTLVELLVVIGMIAVLLGAMGSGISKARERAKIAKATQDVREMTNAILAYESYAPKRSLESVVTGGWTPASEGNLGMILGNAETESGADLPVLYNGPLKDPWGKAYEFTIQRKAGAIASKSESGFVTAPSLPNFYRLSDEERQ